MPKKRSKNGTATAIVADENHVTDSMLEHFSTMSRCSDDSDLKQLEPTESDNDFSSVTTLEKIVTAVNDLYEKRPDVRINAIKSLQNSFRVHFLGLDDSWDNYDTFLSALENSLKRGKTQEQVLASECLAVFAAQLSPFDNRSLVLRFQLLLETKLNDPAVPNETRGACANTLSLIYFFGNVDDFGSLINLMKVLESVFKGSCLKGDGKPPVHSPSKLAMHSACMKAWGMLYTALPTHDAEKIGQAIIPALMSLLQSINLEVRITTGDLVILIYERIRFEVSTDFKGPLFTPLTTLLADLATEMSKAKSKNDLKKQRHSFRDFLCYLKTNELPHEQTVKIGMEKLEIISCCQNFYYNVFCDLLGCGITVHMRENELVRAIFDMGPPLPKSVATHGERTQNKAARHFANQFAFKIRTQNLSSSRDKRTICVENDDD